MPHAVRILWTRDQLVARPSWLRTYNPCKEADADASLRPGLANLNPLGGSYNSLRTLQSATIFYTDIKKMGDLVN